MNRFQLNLCLDAVRRASFGCLMMVVVNWCPAQAPHLAVPVTGGMPGVPLMTEIFPVGTNQVEVRWDGPSGLYRVMRKLELTSGTWQEAVPWNANRSARVPALQAQEFFRVIGPSANYAGSDSCAECHEGIHATEQGTRHPRALETLKSIGQGSNPSCLPCHTVGYQLPTGFTSEAATPHLAGVQCENCHGPAALHVADPFDLTVRPRVEIAGQMCGGCHTGSHHPTYDEWQTTGHAGVTEDMNGGRLEGCGRCHSGSSRLAQLSGLTGSSLTAAVNGDANMGITCVVCHNPHSTTSNPYQLRNPTRSTNDYFLITSGTLGSQYNAQVNVCAQCHNHRGALWNSDATNNLVTLPNGTVVTNNPSVRSPHHSPQYNMLLGTVGVLPAGTPVWASAHNGIRLVTNSLSQVIAVTNQCVTCHMPTEEHQNGPPEVAAVTGHRFEVESYGACLPCHQPLVDPEKGEAAMRDLVELTAAAIEMQLWYTKSLLDEWATQHAPAALTNYGALAWEYRPAGDLNPGANGPTLAEQQASVPDAIKKARFNLYLVLYDGSGGSHNPFYALDLLEAAQDWAIEAMSVAPE
ncbi:MAG: ammonia-forming cytochrome c nitrite reductase subunit c552 [Verrucomicrobia bacterium]|jgi:hypothetical protein|nr:ammonia-forming cytochrome c nitrite reductase subunit c552 [Verrucomicrobiota bacterium]